MKKINLLFVSLALAASAYAQVSPAGPNVRLGSGAAAASTLVCDSSSVGALYTQTTPGGVTNVCQQTSLGVYGWATAPAVSGGSVVVVAGKTLTVDKSLELTGTDGTVETFPTTSATIARTDAAQTFTGVQTLSSAPVLSTSTLTAGSSLITFPAAAITVPGTILTDCGTSASCATPTTRSSTAKIVIGTIAFSSATTATITGISPAFTATQSYTCYASDPTHAAYAQSTQNASGTSFVITSGTSNSDTWNYFCAGY